MSMEPWAVSDEYIDTLCAECVVYGDLMSDAFRKGYRRGVLSMAAAAVHQKQVEPAGLPAPGSAAYWEGRCRVAETHQAEAQATIDALRVRPAPSALEAKCAAAEANAAHWKAKYEEAVLHHHAYACKHNAVPATLPAPWEPAKLRQPTLPVHVALNTYGKAEALARECAVAFAKEQDKHGWSDNQYSYMRHIAVDTDWQPHPWVVHAVQRAASICAQAPAAAPAAPVLPTPPLLRSHARVSSVHRAMPTAQHHEVTLDFVDGTFGDTIGGEPRMRVSGSVSITYTPQQGAQVQPLLEAVMNAQPFVLQLLRDDGKM